MNDRILSLAEYALHNDPYPSVIKVDFDPEDEALPESIRNAKRLKEYLLSQTVSVLSNELLAGRMRFDGSVVSCAYVRGGHKYTNTYWNNHCFSHPQSDLYYYGWTHYCTNYQYILTHGFSGYLKRIRIAQASYIGDQEKTDFLTALEIICDGVCKWAALHAEACQKMAESDTDHETISNWLRLSDICKKVPEHPAENFREAVQSIWFGFLLMPDSLGRLDQYLYPYFVKDMQAGLITRDTALELIEELLIKVFEHKGSKEHRSGDNHFVVGGYLENGEDGYNDLSSLILEAVSQLPTYRPEVSFRWTRKTPFDVLKYVTEMNKKCMNIVFVSDEPRVQGLVRKGIAYEDAVNYTMVGCNEWAVVGKSKLDLVHANLMHSLWDLLYHHTDDLSETNTFDDFFAVYERYLHRDVETILSSYPEFLDIQKKDVNVLSSVLIDDCIEKGTSITSGGARYNGITVSFNGIPNVIDSLSVIKQYVYDERRYTMDELVDFLKDDWQNESVLIDIAKRGRFFGNDLDDVDKIGTRIVDSLDKCAYQSLYAPIGIIFFGSFVGYTNPNIILAAKMGATPDGRRAGEEFTMGIGQSQNKDKEGITALLKSVAKLGYEKLCGTVVTNLKLDRKLADTDEKLTRLAHVFETFLQLGGIQFQTMYLSTTELIKAQQNPDQYKNLRVRVTGYSGLFTSFDRDLQNDIIKRTEHNA